MIVIGSVSSYWLQMAGTTGTAVINVSVYILSCIAY